MKKTFGWYTLCFLVFYSPSSGGLKHENFISLFKENVSVINTVQLLIPTLNSENPKCREHSRLYLEQLRNFKLWATEMFDANAKYPSGILYGSTYDLGNFDQCMEVKVPLRSTQFTGKYCIAKFTVNPPNDVGVNYNIDYDRNDYRQYFNISTWEKIAMYTKVEATVLLNGPIIVDTFFIISGFLATYLTIALFEKSKGSVNIIMLYVHKVIRWVLDHFGRREWDWSKRDV
ncbi:hypothetical protein NQ314_009355 [Rhamnusium bicolor]|uniref:Nose resistant-to-fluoxetine protein N-terminal domain-containing protein n=1 Tax=Rhamnusium bicolor TaxID=1586634 RepID=A0AAV8Y335_9CUCU|nr:hypothetical protein NQ314_009355 [Rhamnusium bicolor]